MLLYPAIISFKIYFDKNVRNGEFPKITLPWFKNTSHRYQKWAKKYMETGFASSVDSEDVAGTEWPIFGSVFYLLTAEEIQSHIKDKDSCQIKEITLLIQKTADIAADVITDPKTGNWVKEKWGSSYLTKKNLFYRMLLIMGLSSYEKVTGNKRYRKMLYDQTTSLGRELLNAPSHLLDDYPGECYPNDVVWAVASIIRADKLLGTDHSALKSKLIDVLKKYSLTNEGLPGFIVDEKTARPLGIARGCGNSGILMFVPELDMISADKWFKMHDKYFWQEDRFFAGYREASIKHNGLYEDVDSGPVLFGYGTVASAFGVGAARTMGRFDRSVPIMLEASVFSWPTPFGCLIPSLMGSKAADSSCLGEIAMLFCMTRPVMAEKKTSYKGNGPGSFWILSSFYLIGAIVLLSEEFRIWRKLIKKLNRS
ncbi:MAG: hypothetical protein KAI43_08650 [Candidatus Aureabacteria bacterium]|nr:hypothetical protein [Candidatus Auribacterota bacterium]